MIKVVGRDESAVKNTTCHECAARLEYTPSDVVTLWSGTDYGGGSDGAKGFKCPNCNSNVILERW